MTAPVRYTMHGQMPTAPYQDVTWSVYDTPDYTGAFSGFGAGFLINIYVDYTIVDNVTSGGNQQAPQFPVPLPPDPITPQVTFVMKGLCSTTVPPNQLVTWRAVGNPDFTGTLSGFPAGTLSNIVVDYSINDSVTSGSSANASFTNLSGDVTGPASNNVVIGLQQRPLLATAPLLNQTIGWNGSAWAPSNAGAIVTFAGDLSGNNNSQTVIGLQNNPVSATTPTSGQVLEWNGTSWFPTSGPTPGGVAGGDLGGIYPNPTVDFVGKNQLRYVTIFLTSSNAGSGIYELDTDEASHPIINVYGDNTAPGTVVLKFPNNFFGGQLVTNVNLDRIVTVTNYSSIYHLDGYLSNTIDLTIACDTVTNTISLPASTLSMSGSHYNYPTQVQFRVTAGFDFNNPVSLFIPVSYIGGDLSNTIWNDPFSTTVVGLQTIPISTTTPTSGQSLVFNGTSWIPTTGPTPGGSAGGDLSGTYPNPTVAKIDGASVPAAGSLTTGNVLQVNGGSSLTYAPVNLAGGANFVTGVLPIGNQAAQNMVGDVTGTTSSNTVNAIQHNTVTSGGLTKGNIFIASSTSNWSPFDFSGDVSNSHATAGLITVTGIQGNTFSAGNPSSGQFVLATSTSSYGPATITGDIFASNVTAGLLTNIGIRGKSLNSSLASIGITQDGYTLTWVNANNDWEALPTIATAVTMGGDVTGISSSSTVIKINGATVSTAAGSLVTGKVLRVTGSSAVDYGAVDLANANAITGLLPNANQAAQSMAGDVTGTTAASVVVALRSKSLDVSLASIGASQDGYVLTWDNADGYWASRPTTGLSAIGTINSQTKSANGLVLLSNILYAQTADASFPGMVSTGTQTFAGDKTLSGATTLSALGNGIVHSSGLGALTSSLIVNADVSASAAIAGTKISPAFGGQNISTTGSLTAGQTGINDIAILGNVQYSVSLYSSGTNNSMSHRCFILEDTLSGGTRSCILPSPATAGAGSVYFIRDKQNNFATTNLIVNRAGSEKIDGVAANLTLSTNGQQIMIWTDGTDWYTQGNLSAGSAGGDLTGSYPNPTVAAIRGKSLNSSLASIGAAQDGYALTWDNTDGYWLARPQTGGGGGSGITALTGDVTASGSGSVAATIKTMQAVTTVTKTTDYTITTSDYRVCANFSSAHNLTLPAPATGMTYEVWDISGTAETNNITLVRHGSENINGIAASRILSTNWGHWTIFSPDGTNWIVG